MEISNKLGVERKLKSGKNLLDDSALPAVGRGEGRSIPIPITQELYGNIREIEEKRAALTSEEDPFCASTSKTRSITSHLLDVAIEDEREELGRIKRRRAARHGGPDALARAKGNIFTAATA